MRAKFLEQTLKQNTPGFLIKNVSL